MLKALLIYESDSGLYVYHKYFCNDLIDNPQLLSSLIHVIRLINQERESINELMYQQFQISFNDGELIVKDCLDNHKRIYFHDNKGFSGVITAEDDYSFNYSDKIFKVITDYLSNKKVLHELKYNNEVISTIDNFLRFAVEH